MIDFDTLEAWTPSGSTAKDGVIGQSDFESMREIARFQQDVVGTDQYIAQAAALFLR